MKPPRIRLSLETTRAFMDELLAHRKELGTRSIIGTIRAAVKRSRELWARGE